MPSTASLDSSIRSNCTASSDISVWNSEINKLFYSRTGHTVYNRSTERETGKETYKQTNRQLETREGTRERKAPLN